MKLYNPVILVAVACLFCSQCAQKSTEPEKPEYQPAAQTAPESTLVNFQYVYNFCQDSLAVDKAIAGYLNCFSSDMGAPQYEFKYWTAPNTNPVFWILAEEMNATARMFSEVDQKKLNLYLKTFTKKSSWVEAAADTAAQIVKHPAEDWYVFEMTAYLTMNDPNPANYPFLVQGDGLFYLRRCADGFYRIIRWEDLTYLSLPSPKSTFLSNAIVSHNYTWGSIKAMYK